MLSVYTNSENSIGSTSGQVAANYSCPQYDATQVYLNYWALWPATNFEMEIWLDIYTNHLLKVAFSRKL